MPQPPCMPASSTVSPGPRKGKNICTPVGREGDWIAPSVEAPSSSQIYDSLRNSTTGKLCGSFWIHLGKDDIRREICDFFLKNFQAALEMAAFTPCNAEDYHETIVPHRSFERHRPMVPVWSH